MIARTVAMTVLVLATGGCLSAPEVRTTFLGSVDLIDMTDQMAMSFAQDPHLSQRTPEDAPWVVSVDRVTNHTNQIMPQREKWLYIGRLRAMLSQSDVASRYDLIWVIPPERWGMVAEELGVSEEPYGMRMDPTHLLSAEFGHVSLLVSPDGHSQRDDRVGGHLGGQTGTSGPNL